MYEGDTYEWTFRLWTDDAHTVPVDLAGCTVAAQIRDRPGGIVLQELALTVTLPNEIAAAPFEAEAAGRWDLQVTNADGKVQTVLAGSVNVTPDVTELDVPS